MITDDGEFLIVLNEYNSDSALRIYRRPGHNNANAREGPVGGTLVKDIALKDLWPADKLEGGMRWDGEMQQWYSGGFFEFSPYCRCLLHTTRWGSAVRINLWDGSVARVAEERPYAYPNY
jgi:hypothetical protein